ncbi:hypothetical protein HYC85_030397 [Camellia sinensis]|uniref:Uncharacterized protein n=1 Tax=Camellia sinensis TaxID=4442 RepID=A0A7J7G4N9_CAMSI|nr:hypothetical protein HYC85_030397 [Camellia sinensis]
MINDAINMLKSNLQLPQNFPEKGLPARAPHWPLERTVKRPELLGGCFLRSSGLPSARAYRAKIWISASKQTQMHHMQNPTLILDSLLPPLLSLFFLSSTNSLSLPLSQIFSFFVLSQWVNILNYRHIYHKRNRIIFFNYFA